MIMVLDSISLRRKVVSNQRRNNVILTGKSKVKDKDDDGLLSTVRRSMKPIWKGESYRVEVETEFSHTLANPCRYLLLI